MITPKRFNGSGPKKDANTPGCVETVSSLTLARPFKASIKPPLVLSTAPITTMMPASITIPCRKSLIAVAI